MDLLVSVGSLMLVIIADILLYFLVLRRTPPYIKNTAGSRCSDDCIVCSYAVIRHGTGHYVEYHFVRRKNGRYRLKYSVLDWIMTIIVWGGFGTMYVWLVYNEFDGIIRYPEVAVGYAAIGAGLASLGCLLTFSRITARIYFRRYRKQFVSRKKD